MTSVVVASKTFSSPSPPRKVPAPAESAHRPVRVTRSGKFISSASTGMFMQFVTSVSTMWIPSFAGRAPIPPAASSLATNGRPVSGSVPPNAMTSRVPELAAGMRCGSARTSAPRMVSAMRLMVAVRQLTGAGGLGLTRLPGGSTTSTARKQPPLFGTVGSEMARTA